MHIVGFPMNFFGTLVIDMVVFNVVVIVDSIVVASNIIVVDRDFFVEVVFAWKNFILNTWY